MTIDAAGAALDVDDERDPAGVVLEARVVEPERLGDALNGVAARAIGVASELGFVISHPRTHARYSARKRTGGRRGTTLALLRKEQISRSPAT